MLLLQAAIGALNDLHDRPADRLARPDKPIPAGLVAPRSALWLAGLAGPVGLALAAVSPFSLAIAVVGLADGLAYDLRLKGTALSWLPFALGLPLLLLFAASTAPCLPPSIASVLPLAVLAGASLALANALADRPRDAAAGVRSTATALGDAATWRLDAGLSLTTLVVAAVLFGVLRGGPPDAAGVGGLAAAAALQVAGLGLLRSRAGRRPELGWEVQAIGFAVLALVWLVGAGHGPSGC